MTASARSANADAGDAGDASVDASTNSSDGGSDGGPPVRVEAGVRPPQPCLTPQRPDDDDSDTDGCAVSATPADDLAGAALPAIAAVAALIAARRRSRHRS
jgi:MYXO-CTERM domain-containing protein